MECWSESLGTSKNRHFEQHSKSNSSINGKTGYFSYIWLLQSCIIMKWLAKCQSEERQLGTWMVLPFMSKNGSFGSLSSPLKLSHKKCIWKWFSCMIKTSSFTIEKKEKNMSKMKVSCHELTEDRQKRKPKSSAVYLMCLTQVYSEFLLGLSRLLKHTCASANSGISSNHVCIAQPLRL